MAQIRDIPGNLGWVVTLKLANPVIESGLERRVHMREYGQCVAVM